MALLPTTPELGELAHDVVANGFEAHQTDVARLVGLARRHGIRPVLTSVLADATAPRPVRERALGLLLMAVAAHSASLSSTTTAATAA